MTNLDQYALDECVAGVIRKLNLDEKRADKGPLADFYISTVINAPLMPVNYSFSIKGKFLKIENTYQKYEIVVNLATMYAWFGYSNMQYRVWVPFNSIDVDYDVIYMAHKFLETRGK